jgi:5-methylcytosine-specific restriction endonuclease McrA
MATRAPIPRFLSQEIAFRQGYACAECGSLMRTWEIDHRVALCLGGENHVSNYHALCPNCHSFKTKVDLWKRQSVSPYFIPGSPRCVISEPLLILWRRRKDPLE